MNNVTLAQAVQYFLNANQKSEEECEQVFYLLVTAIRNESNMKELDSALALIPEENDFLRSLITTQMFLYDFC